MVTIFRIWLPATLVVAGLVVIAVGGATETALAVGIPILSAGLSIRFLNSLVRLGHTGDLERDKEQAARDFFSAHGRWPAEGELS